MQLGIGKLTNKYNLYGGNLINLVLAGLIQESGQQFTWYTLGEKVAGHFSGINIDGLNVDLGMVLLEFGCDDLNILDGSKDANTTRSLIQYFHGFMTEPAKIQSKFESTLNPDLIISDECELIWNRKYSSDLSIKGAAHKWSDNYFDQITYDEYCKAAYSDFYAELLENFASKISYGGHKILSARYHRSAWLPLYFPDTVTGTNRAIRPYPLRKFLGKSIAQVISEKYESLKSNHNNLIITEKFEDLSGLKSLSNEKNSSVKNFISCDLSKFSPEYERILKESTYQTKISIAIFSYESDVTNDVDCINDIDDKMIYRVSFQSFVNGAVKFVVVEGAAEQGEDLNWQIKAESYLKDELGLRNLTPKFVRSFINGPKLPKCGSEKILNDIKANIDAKYCSGNRFNYGIQNGFQALSMNRQISYAINEWSRFL